MGIKHVDNHRIYSVYCAYSSPFGILERRKKGGGTGHDVMIGGRGANYFDCGLNGNALILNFNPAKGDTKSPSCKFVITVGPRIVPG